MANGNVTIYLGTELEQKMKDFAESNRRSVSQQIALIIDDYLSGKLVSRDDVDDFIAAVKEFKASRAKGE